MTIISFINNKSNPYCMKHFLLLVLLCLTMDITIAQTLYKQDFSNGKADMITIDNDKRTADSQVAAFAESWTVTESRSPGNPAAVNNSWYSPVGRADDWLITPVISGIDEKTIVTWKARALDASFPNGYRVLVAANGGDKISDFKDILLNLNRENPDLTTRAILLDKFVGKDIRIAFHDNSNDMFLLLLDDIEVVKLLDRDARLNLVSSTGYVLNGTEAEVYYEFENTGFDKITSIELEFNDGVNSHIEKINDLDIAFGAKYEGVYSYLVKNNGKNSINVKIVSVNNAADLNDDNNLGSTSFNGVSKLINRKLVAEEATGTWCVWCPRGAVFMEKMAKDYPDDFIGIAVHNNDPMTVTAYDAGIRSFPGFQGFPQVIVNRQAAIDPQEMPDYMEFVTAREASPVELSVRQTKVNRKLTIEGDVEFFTDIDDADLGIVVVVVEDGVKGTATGYNQANAYAGGQAGPMGGYENLKNPVPAADMVYNEVARAIPFGFNGKSDIIPSKVKVGDVFLFSVDYTSPTIQKLDNLHSVMFVVNNKTREIIGGAKTKSFAVNVEDIKELEHVSIYPNPTSNISFINLNLKSQADVKVTISNNLGQVVASKDYGRLSDNQILPLHTDNFSTGLYHIQIMINGKITSQKLIVE